MRHLGPVYLDCYLFSLSEKTCSECIFPFSFSGKLNSKNRKSQNTNLNFSIFFSRKPNKKKLKTKKEIKSHKPSDTYNIRGIQILQIGKKTTLDCDCFQG